jgi:hypothetical protein
MNPQARQTDTCPATGKLAHRHRSAALAALRGHATKAKASGNTMDERMVAYLCVKCSRWHVGTNDDELRRAKRIAARRPRDLTPDDGEGE